MKQQESKMLPRTWASRPGGPQEAYCWTNTSLLQVTSFGTGRRSPTRMPGVSVAKQLGIILILGSSVLLITMVESYTSYGQHNRANPVLSNKDELALRMEKMGDQFMPASW